MLFIASALLVVMQQQTVVPNQEIVLEFEDLQVSSLEAQNAITVVKKQLGAIGVTNLRISKELHNGRLKIAYYSDADINRIKKILSDDQHVAMDHVFYDQHTNSPEVPLEDTNDYSLNVYEIQKSTDTYTDFNGICVLEVKQKQERASGSYVYGSTTIAATNHIHSLLEAAKKVHRSIVLTIDNTSYKIPEVRAGPFA